MTLPAPELFETQALAAMQAVAVRPPGAFLWFGRRVAVDAPAPASDPLGARRHERPRTSRAGPEPPACGREALVAAIAARLLADFAATGVPRPRRPAPAARASDAGAFARALSQANCGRGAWQPGWRVAGVEDDGIAVERDGLRLLATAGDVRCDGEARAGSAAEVRLPKERTGPAPGLVVALGDTPGPGTAEPLARLTWNVAAAGAPTLVARVTYALNGAGVAFSLALPADPAGYASRAATASLLLARAHLDAALGLLRPQLRALSAHLADGAPAFARPLGRGPAMADEPAGDHSFAEHRCAVLADAIVAAAERGVRTPEEHVALARARFAAAGVALDRPYLDGGPDVADARP